MSLIEEYSGFLNSKPLSKLKNLFGFSYFDFETISKTTHVSKTLVLDIPKNEVLGKRIEYFFEHLISTSLEYEIIVKNLQVFRDKTTIGELDFLLNDLRNEKAVHVELVYKFYIYDSSIDSELHRWIGPNRNDSLLQKIKKINRKQLPLLFKNESLSLLKGLRLESHDIRQEVCFLANLFVSKPSYITQKTFPNVNNECIIGYWIKQKDFVADAYKSFKYHIPNKQNWIVSPNHCNQWYSFEITFEHVKQHLNNKKSPLLWMKRGDNSFERFFIVWW